MHVSIVSKEYLQYLRKSTVWREFFLFSLVVGIVHQLFHAILYHFTFLLWPAMKAVSVHILLLVQIIEVKIRSLTFLKLSVPSTDLTYLLLFFCYESKCCLLCVTISVS